MQYFGSPIKKTRTDYANSTEINESLKNRICKAVVVHIHVYTALPLVENSDTTVACIAVASFCRVTFCSRDNAVGSMVTSWICSDAINLTKQCKENTTVLNMKPWGSIFTKYSTKHRIVNKKQLGQNQIRPTKYQMISLFYLGIISLWLTHVAITIWTL